MVWADSVIQVVTPEDLVLEEMEEEAGEAGDNDEELADQDVPVNLVDVEALELVVALVVELVHPNEEDNKTNMNWYNSLLLIISLTT